MQSAIENLKLVEEVKEFRGTKTQFQAWCAARGIFVHGTREQMVRQAEQYFERQAVTAVQCEF